MAHEVTGRRQGTTELGFHICPHTCGCQITDSIANKLHRKPKWLQRTPVFLKAGSHSGSHISNKEVHPDCGPACQGFTKKGRPLTDREYSAWVPHLGNWQQFHPHIPISFHNLIPVVLLEDEYHGILPPHPLPHPSVQSLQQGMVTMSMQPQASMSGPASAMTSTQPHQHQASMSGPTSASTSTHPHHRHHYQASMSGPASASTSTPPYPQAGGSRSLGTASGSKGEAPKVLFIGTPRAGFVTSLEMTEGLMVYEMVNVSNETPERIQRTLRTAPDGFVFSRPASPSDPYPEVETFVIHDLVSVLYYAIILL